MKILDCRSRRIFRSALIPVHELFSLFHLAAGAELEPEELALGERRTLSLGEAFAATGRGRRCLSSAASLPFPRGIFGCGLSIQPKTPPMRTPAARVAEKWMSFICGVLRFLKSLLEFCSFLNASRHPLRSKSTARQCCAGPCAWPRRDRLPESASRRGNT